MKKIAVSIIMLLILVIVDAQDYNIEKYGAVDDGITLNTTFIQAAINAAFNKGGGRVVIPSGKFLSGTIRMKNGVELHLNEGAILLGSTIWKHYEKNRWYALILAENIENISITGKGIIDGQGRELAKDVRKMVEDGVLVDKLSHDRPDEKYRPQLVEFTNCNNVLIKGITMKNASCWVQTYRNCTNLIIDSLTVRSTAFWNNDGIDVVDCKNVKIINCDVDAADDGICLKSSDSSSLCQNVEIRSCKIRSSATAVKFGTPSFGGFKGISISNIYVYDTYRTAIALEVVDGGIVEDINIRNVIAKNVGGAIFLRIGQRKQNVPPGTIKNVTIKDMEVTVPLTKPDAGYEMDGPLRKFKHNPFPSSIVGLPGADIENIVLENIIINFGGGGKTSNAYVSLDSLATIPEVPQDYPEFSMFGELPTWGMYIRHAKNIKMNNIQFNLKQADYRPLLVFDDVKKIELNNVSSKSALANPAVIFKNVTGKIIKNVSFLKLDKSNIKNY